LILLLSFQKDSSSSPELQTYTVTINKIGNGTVLSDKTQGISAGSSVTFNITPSASYSIYSIKINGKALTDKIPFDSGFQYTYFGLNSNLTVEVVFVETYNLIISAITPPWKLKAMDIYKEDGHYYSLFPFLKKRRVEINIFISIIQILTTPKPLAQTVLEHFMQTGASQ